MPATFRQESAQSVSAFASVTGAGSADRLWIALICGAAIGLGAVEAWQARHLMHADGISYLDMASAAGMGHWKQLVNGYWSPLYPLVLAAALKILRPSPYWEFPVVHLANFCIYLFALGGFQFFLTQFIRRLRLDPVEAAGRVRVPLSAVLLLGYALFLWTSRRLITLSGVTPDLLVAALVYLACGLLLRIRENPDAILNFVLLGFTLGLGYLAKAVMFPLALVFLAVAFFCARRLCRRTLVAVAMFALVAVPWIVVLSRSKGSVTFGDSGRLNYAWRVNRIIYPPDHWEGGPAGAGTPAHTARKLREMPPVYEFGPAVPGTYPLWDDPSYWYAGLHIRFDWRNQLRAFASTLRSYHDLVFHYRVDVLVLILLICSIDGRYRALPGSFAAQWPMLVPVLTAVIIYALVVVNLRYLGAFITIFWLSMLAAARVPDSQKLSRGIRLAALAVSLIIVSQTAVSSVSDAFFAEAPHFADLQWQIAATLQQMGIKPGDQVARIDSRFSPSWARLARVRVVAEIPGPGAAAYWAAAPEVQTDVLRELAGTGAKAVVAESAPQHATAGGWDRVGSSEYCVRLLEPLGGLGQL